MNEAAEGTMMIGVIGRGGVRGRFHRADCRDVKQKSARAIPALWSNNAQQ